MPLFNLLSNRLDDFLNTSNEENVINHCQTKNATSLQLLNIGKNRVAGYSEIENGALGRNKVANYSQIEEEATRRNGIVGHFEKKKGIESVNKDMSKVSFFN